jgi:PAS domain S-box-containing protein
MSFRLKLGIALCSVLFLTITVALTSWWGMDTALNRQRAIFTFSLDVDRLLNTMSHEEHAYLASRKITDALTVNDIQDELRNTIETARSWFNENQQEQVRLILDDLARYRQEFSDFSRQMVDMETMQSRLIQESDRLLSSTRDLTGQDSGIAVTILQQVSRMLLAETEYMLTDSADAASTVIAVAAEIERLANHARQQTESNANKLKIFRLAKVAVLYREIFTSYLEEQKKHTVMLHNTHHSRDDLAARIRLFVDRELELSRAQTNRLQFLTIAVSLAAVALSVLLTIVLATRITRPLAQLKDSARDILNGNLDTTVSIDSRDEIGQLGNIFNQMTLKLRQNFEDIMLYRDHLEELVEDRTRELKREMAERSAAEHALRVNEERLRTIVDQSPMGIILWNTNFEVMKWNRAAEKIFGYPMAEAFGMHASRLLPKSMHPHIDKIWRKLITTQDGVRSHNENLDKQGRIILCDWFNTPIFDPYGTLLGALSLVENVTERMRTEKELLKLEKLESTGILAGGIAHDFNNILTAILGNINLSLFDASLAKKTRELLVSAEKAAIRAKSLTQQLLTFAKGGEPIPESTSLAEIIEDSATFVLHGGNVSCRYLLPDDLWYAIVDRGQISQVIQNIVLNSRHAMPEGGSIVIRGANVLPETDSFALLDREKKYIKITISDNGIGIPAGLLDKIFDPYFSTKQEGSGLGLAITLSIINKHHGHILVNSEQGKGTEFTIYLPAIDRPVDDNSIEKDGKPAPARLRLLVMDDDETVRMVLQSMLELLGHQAILTSNGREAVSLYREQFDSSAPFDLVIVDLTIPGGMGGKETMDELRRTDPKVRVIVSSGYSNDPVMSSYRDHGFCAAVSKPYVLKELSTAIETALGEVVERPPRPHGLQQQSV